MGKNNEAALTHKREQQWNCYRDKQVDDQLTTFLSKEMFEGYSTTLDTTR